MKTVKIISPADVPTKSEKKYVKNYKTLTKHGKVLIFAADQKMEHLHEDVIGNGLPKELANPKHFFEIAQKGKISAFATQLGLVSQYGKEYSEIPYIIKLNSKTNLIKPEVDDPYSELLWGVDDIVEFHKNSKLNIIGIGYTIYLGSKHEPEMLQTAANLVLDAHQHGYIATLWIYPRGKSIERNPDPLLCAGATGVAACLGADFVKIQPPYKQNKLDKAALEQAVKTAGKTKVLCAGGPAKDNATFIKNIKEQMSVDGIGGLAVGRNIFQKKLTDALTITKEIVETF